MRLILPLLATATALALGACGSSAPVKPAAPAPVAAVSTAQLAEANLAPASASLVSGRLVLVPEAGGVHITGTIGSLPRSQPAAFHVHEKGDCSAVDASSAGPHFNPLSQPHGRAGAGAHHAGDMDNLQANAEGVAQVDVHLRGVTLGGGAANDIAGRALIVHAGADDYRSQPAGNAGARVACAVIRVVR
ncbi:superoxide dismutase [Stenotrophomonas pictorum JCM 9942]|jgi:Cu-Zn family superoxide dismutase|uniref:Superoxide dismutase [Cu-Zn] n=1 Tax=Stenotrophomonas pictorum JCM 9942 TaxID=1236960 RepID=A0A0R0ADC0_9GAMM|nr:superoxide dismutase family protein [Stenotrophomonas pictorum]KRG42912.1 superoxide dismutase [Stenotrophomonas pictorum JCM 9942]